MSRNKITVTSSGIKCDNCDFVDEDVQFESFNDWVDEPCPNCSENLLTASHLSDLKSFMTTAQSVNTMIDTPVEQPEQTPIPEGFGERSEFV